jgi:hypothetical protein
MFLLGITLLAHASLRAHQIIRCVKSSGGPDAPCLSDRKFVFSFVASNYMAQEYIRATGWKRYVVLAYAASTVGGILSAGGVVLVLSQLDLPK